MMDQKPLNKVVFTFECIESVKNTILPIECHERHRIETNLRIAEGGQYIGIGQNEGAQAFYCRVLPREKNTGLKVFKAKFSQGLTGDEIANYRAVGEAAKREFDFLRDLKGAEGHAPSVFAYGEILREDGSRQWAMIEEHVEGLTLDEYISYASGGDHVSLDAKQVLWLGFRIAEACDACYISEHEDAQITHRDLSPDNLRFFASEDGRELDRVVLLDFGNAVEATRQERTPTWMNRNLAKVKYGAPEMFANDVTRNATVSDAWAIGAIMHYARTFQVPFEKDLNDFIGLQVLDGDQCSSIKDIKSHPVDLRAVIRKATEDRVVGVRGFSAEELDDFLCKVVEYATLVEVDQSKHNSRPTISSLHRLLSMITALLDYAHDREREIQQQLLEFQERSRITPEVLQKPPETQGQHESRPIKSSEKTEQPLCINVNQDDPCPCGSSKKFKNCHGHTERVNEVNEQLGAARNHIAQAVTLLDHQLLELLAETKDRPDSNLASLLHAGESFKRKLSIELASKYAKFGAALAVRRFRRASESDYADEYLRIASIFKRSADLLTGHAKSKYHVPLIGYQILCEHNAYWSSQYFFFGSKRFQAATGVNLAASFASFKAEIGSCSSLAWAAEVIDLLTKATQCNINAIKLLEQS